MKMNPDWWPGWSRGRLIAIIAAGLALLVLAGVGIYGLLTGPRTTVSPDGPVPGPATMTAPASATPSTAEFVRVPEVPRSADPATFASSVAMALFAWDTGSGLMPVDYTGAILRVGDPSGVEQSGLASDVATYLPTRDAWLGLRKYATTQHLTIDKTFTPDAWNEAVAQARPGQLPAGATAVTVEGTRHRDGVWNGEKITSQNAVSFTVFMACPPPTPESSAGLCHVLRLSQLDNPLR